ncbi:Poly(A)-specific ribonuclease pnldc1 [Chamberlinius hualienensis]
MDVTSANFKELLPAIEAAINEATFLTIDAEFTGLNVAKTLHAYDTPEERYSKLREGALDFLLIQFGLCAFKWKESRCEYKPFNIYVFPKPGLKNGPDLRFMCQSSSIDFLVSQGFDFNKLFRDGISYLNPNDEIKLKEQLGQKHNTNSSRFGSPQTDSEQCLVPIPEEHKEFIEETCNKISEFLKREEEVLDLAPCNSFLRKLIFQTGKQRFPSGIYLESKSTPKKEFYISITKVNCDKLKEMEDAKRTSEIEELNDAIGFSKIIKLISSSGKLVVGHNMLLDVLHVIDKFCCRLPADYEDFKAISKCVFPRLIDTKLMASTFPFKERITKTNLGDLVKILNNSPFQIPDIAPSEGFEGYNTSEEQLHEAGYDAFITGLCFTSMAGYLGRFPVPKAQNSFHLDWTLLEPFLNKLYLMLVQDIPYMNLADEDVKPNRDHVFHVRFPKDWKTSDLIQLFSPFGHVYVAWINDTSAFISLTRKDQAVLVMRTLTQSDTYHVKRYCQFAAEQQRKNSSNKNNSYEKSFKSKSKLRRRKRPLEESTPVRSSKRVTFSSPTFDGDVSTTSTPQKSTGDSNEQDTDENDVSSDEPEEEENEVSSSNDEADEVDGSLFAVPNDW